MKISVMQSEHVDEVARLYAQVFSEPPWNEEWRHTEALLSVRNPLLRWWVAIKEEKVMGFVGGCVADATFIATTFRIPSELLGIRKVGYLAELGVNPHARRQGLARDLSNELLDFFRKEDVEQFIVRTRPGTGNHPWYTKMLTCLYEYQDGRTIFGCDGVPVL